MTEPENPDTTYVDLPLVYVAGPYTHPDPVHNTHKLIHFVSQMIDDGVVTPFAPHLTLLWHIVAPRPLPFWYAYDIAMLARCDAVLRVEGASSGADAEVAYANEIGLPVFNDTERLYEWARQR